MVSCDVSPVGDREINLVRLIIKDSNNLTKEMVNILRTFRTAFNHRPDKM